MWLSDLFIGIGNLFFLMPMLTELLERVKNVQEGLQDGEIIRDVVVDHEDDIMDLQLLQLFQGKASNGDDIHPYYTEDLKPSGFFNSVEAAKRYSDWKQTISYPRQADRNADAPNLFINGRFHSELGVEFGSDSVVVAGTTSYANNIVDKYGLNTFGLTKENWDIIFRERGGLPELLQLIKKQLYTR